LMAWVSVKAQGQLYLYLFDYIRAYCKQKRKISLGTGGIAGSKIL